MSNSDLAVVFVLWGASVLLLALWVEKILAVLREIRDELRK